MDEQGFVPCSFFAGQVHRLTPRRPRDGHQQIVWNEASRVSNVQNSEDHRCDECGPAELAPDPMDRWCSGISTRGNLSALLLVAHTPGQYGEKRHPPNQEIDGNDRTGTHGVTRVFMPALVQREFRKNPSDGETERACHVRRFSARHRRARARLAP